VVRYLAQGRRVLDCSCHVGPFGLNAAGDATYVRGVDISDITLELAQNKARLNKENGSVDPKTPIDFTCADTVDYLPKHAHDRDFPRAESGPFDLISLDPPAFTKSKGSLNHAKKGYEEIDEAAVHLLPCGGYLATCSCSHFTTQELLSEAIQTAAHHMKNVRLRQIELR
jgi:23S rRNA (cytosine1962-C5)-methyltransferase